MYKITYIDRSIKIISSVKVTKIIIELTKSTLIIFDDLNRNLQWCYAISCRLDFFLPLAENYCHHTQTKHKKNHMRTWLKKTTTQWIFFFGEERHNGFCLRRGMRVWYGDGGRDTGDLGRVIRNFRLAAATFHAVY